jgi:hypothetical protein
MIRNIAVGSALALLVVGSAQAVTVIRTGAQSDSFASISSPTRTFNVPAKQHRLKVTLAGVAVVREYTYGDSYEKVYGPDQTMPAESTSGNVSLECIAKGQQWWRSSDTSRSLIAGVTMIQIPLRSAWRCRISASASAYGTGMPLFTDTVSMSVTLRAVTTR